ncbi:WG repeat-containing protein [Pinibacter soli]|uniref:WG repeat-containing protein n=1 Tax=Pinibacter soli TaxID=3044211 RepID=A0ABT6RFS9_9BACT|nr:WG repeat-containing protein [Pinibacter soli]MDI3321429.1 WG repeat-containing protein [Pinibacter soli]
MKQYFLLATTILMISSCIDNHSKTKKEPSEKVSDSSHSKTEKINFEQLTGSYNKETDAWVTHDPKYTANIDFDNTPIGTFEFNGELYASISEMDKDGNSLGMGLINKKGQIVVKPKYGTIMVGFVNGLCEVRDRSDKYYGLVSENGIEVVAPQYYDCMELNDNDSRAIDSTMIKVCKNEKQGFINVKGEIVIPLQYQSLDLVGEKLIMFMKEPAKWGFINYKNEIVIQPEFSHTNIFRDGKMTLQRNDGEEYIVYANGKVEKK